MQKIAFRAWSAYGGNRHVITKTLLVMKLTFLLLTAAFLNVSATAVSQKVNFSGNDVPLENIFREVKKQTGYVFIYTEPVLQHARPVSVTAHNVSIEDFLNAVFKHQPFKYRIKGKNIILTTKLTSETLSAPVFSNNGQQPPITIRVVDTSGRPLSGASLVNKTTGKSTSTDAEGKAKLNVSQEDIISISFVGFKSSTTNGQLIMAGTNGFTITLQPAVSKLDEVQILAYGQTSRRFSTGNVSTVKGTDIQKSPVANPILAVAGRVPGIQIVQATGYSGSGINIVIQGLNSLQKGNSPFYVVDGVPFTQTLLPTMANILKQTGTGSGDGATFGNPLTYLNADDIERIEVLKDADATAIYGSRAANGAVIITTKKGRQGKMRVNVNYQHGFAQVAKKLNLLNTQEYLEMRREAIANDGSAIGPSDDDVNGTWDTTKYTDWQKVLVGNTAKYSNLSTTLTGGTEYVQYLFSFSDHKETTVVPSDFGDHKTSIRMAVDASSLDKKFKAGISAGYVYDVNRLPNRELMEPAMSLAPNTPDLLNPDGSLNWGADSLGNSTIGSHPYASLLSKYSNKTKNLLANANISYEIFKGLFVKMSGGFSNLTTEEFSGVPAAIISPEFQHTFVRSSNFGFNNLTNWIVEPQIAYKGILAEGDLDILVGSAFQQNSADRKLINASGFASDDVLENINASIAVSSPANSAIMSTYKYNAVFFQFGYKYAQRYILSVTGRRDASSRFGSENRFHNFGAVGMGWIFSEENWVKQHLPFLSYGKIRGSYGSTGNDQIGDYNFLSLYQNNTTEIPYRGAGLIVNRLTNPYLQWEQTKKFSAGIDLGFLNDRILFSTVFYQNRTSNLLLTAQLPATAGPIGGLTANLPAIVENKGFEFTLSTNNIRNEHFTWNIDANLSIPRNRIASFPGLGESIYSQLYFLDKPTNVQRSYHSNGVNPITGIYEFLDKDGNITNDPNSDIDNANRFYNPNPTFYGGITNSLSFKNFQFDFLFQFVKQRGVNGPSTAMPGLAKYNQQKDVLRRWQKEGDITDVQRFSAFNFDVYFPHIFNVTGSDAYWTDASFIRLKNVSLSYQLPSAVLKRLLMSQVRIFATAQNLLTITGYKGLDPETQSNSSLPPLRTVTFGINVTL